jgi:hypothetical protein
LLDEKIKLKEINEKNKNYIGELEKLNENNDVYLCKQLEEKLKLQEDIEQLSILNEENIEKNLKTDN